MADCKNLKCTASTLAEWCRENTVVLNVRLNKERDADILCHLSKKRKKSTYVKGLIRDDIRNSIQKRPEDSEGQG